eukprot:COSAG03_NODE_6599_length_1033_cov_2.008565_2_plen_51_part_00
MNCDGVQRYKAPEGSALERASLLRAEAEVAAPRGKLSLSLSLSLSFVLSL